MRLTKLVFLLTLLLATSAFATIIDPSNLHVGTGANTPGAEGLGGDPNLIGTGSTFDIFYNTQGNGNLAIGHPFYLLLAIPVYTGSTKSVTIDSTATMYTPYPGTTTSNVTVNKFHDWGTLTSGDIYTFVGFPGANNSFNYVNMLACDTGQSTCPNATLKNSGPLNGVTITGFDIVSFSIQTSTFAPGDLLNFTGNTMPIGTYVAAIGAITSGTTTKVWDVPFTESGLVNHKVPEPASLLLMVGGLGVLVKRYRRHQLAE